MTKTRTGTTDPKRGAFTLGRSNMAKLNAVEGIRQSRESREMFREFDRDAVPAASRRKAIAEKHGGKA